MAMAMAMARTHPATTTPPVMPLVTATTRAITVADRHSLWPSKAAAIANRIVIEAMTVINVTRAAITKVTATKTITAIPVALTGQRERRPGIRHPRKAVIPSRLREGAEVTGAITTVAARLRTEPMLTAAATERYRSGWLGRKRRAPLKGSA